MHFLVMRYITFMQEFFYQHISMKTKNLINISLCNFYKNTLDIELHSFIILNISQIITSI